MFYHLSSKNTYTASERRCFSLKSYSDFYKTIDCHNNSYFIGANTPSGFAYADSQLLNEESLTRLYILKGGPGTGKSTLMKKCRSYFEALGYTVLSYYCSSDPSSLDSVIIENNGQRIAIADGTAPHAIDARLPGAKSEIVDLGACWTHGQLEANRERIAALAASKAIAFDCSRKYLRTASQILDIIKGTAEKGFYKEKAKGSIRRLIKSLPKPKGSVERRTVITEAISMNGAVRLSTLEKAKRLFAIADCHHLSPLFLELLDCALTASGYATMVSYSPLNEICEIYLPHQNIAFVLQREGLEYYKIIRLSRFADSEYFSRHKAKLRFNERCLIEILNAALDSLKEAKGHHFALEDIYVRAMDFSHLDLIYQKLLEEIEKKLLK